MRILFDFQAFQYQEIGGISQVFTQIISHMQSKTDCVIGVKRSDNIHLWDSKLTTNLKHMIHYNWLQNSGRFPLKRTITSTIQREKENRDYCI